MWEGRTSRYGVEEVVHDCKRERCSYWYRSIMQQKAEELAKKMRKYDLHETSDWLYRFLKHENIV